MKKELEMQVVGRVLALLLETIDVGSNYISRTWAPRKESKVLAKKLKYLFTFDIKLI